MKQPDYSREIVEKYYNPQGCLLEIILKNETVLEGIFIGFFHGDKGTNDPYIIKWHFLPKAFINAQAALILPDGSEDYGEIVKQEDIKSVIFKV